MKQIKIKNINSKGYAILFTLVVISIISMISMGLANTALKQVILSGVARDSTVAFYEADLGSECVMYADWNSSTVLPANIGSVTWNCAGHPLIISKESETYYTISPNTGDSSYVSTDKCFEASIEKKMPGSYIETEVKIRGYNICNKTSLRTVERALLIKY